MINFTKKNSVFFIIAVFVILPLIFYIFVYATKEKQTPHITVVLPYNYCGDFVLYVVEDKTPEVPYKPGDRFHVFNLEGEHGAVARIPNLNEGWFVGFAFYKTGKSMQQHGTFKNNGASGWGESVFSNFYIINPIHKNCKVPIMVDVDKYISMAEKFEHQGLFD